MKSLCPWRTLSAVCLCLALLPRPASGASEAVDCAGEPTDMTIGYGTVLNGANCAVAGTDVDVFRFAGSIGEVIRVVVANVAGPGAVRGEVYDPDGALIFALNPTVIGEGGSGSRYITLTQPGTHTVIVFEVGSDSTASYGVVVERLSPPGPDAVPLALNAPVSDELNPVNDIDMYRFHATAGSLIRISLTPLIETVGQHLQMQVAQPSGALHLGEFTGPNPYFANIPISVTGEHTLQLRPYASNLPPFSYTVQIDCISGPCAPPDCTLEVDPSFEGNTLTLGFHLGNRLGPATWNVWLSVANQMIALWSAPVGNVDPPAAFDVPIAGLPPLGRIALVSSITTGAVGIACFDSDTVDTGPAGAAGSMPTAADIRRQLQGR